MPDPLLDPDFIKVATEFKEAADELHDASAALEAAEFVVQRALQRFNAADKACRDYSARLYGFRSKTIAEHLSELADA